MNPLELVTDTRTHSRIYQDPDLFAREMQRIWHRSWLLVGHESEVPKVGDFKTTTLAGKPVILCRDSSGGLQVLFNSCRHRGTMVCREKTGNTRLFQCMYHAWAYRLDGTLAGVPDRKGYGDSFRFEDFSLEKVPRVESFHGIVFANFDSDARPLEQHLGEARKYIDLAFGGRNTEVIGVQEYEYRGNWKLHLENTVDGYHPRYLHRFLADAGMWSEGQAIDLGGGHGMLAWKNVQARGEAGHLIGFEATEDSPEMSRAMIVFPSMAMVQISDFINLRMVIPIAPDRTRIYAMALGFRGENPETRARRAAQVSAAQGPAGSAGADDIELFEAVQEGIAGTLHDGVWCDMSRGPSGSAVGDLEDETATRAVYKEWRRLMALDARERA